MECFVFKHSVAGESGIISSASGNYNDNGPVIGVIGSIPPHLLDDSKRNKPMDIKNMLIDIGADNREDAIRNRIKPGQQKLFLFVLLHLWQ